MSLTDDKIDHLHAPSTDATAQSPSPSPDHDHDHDPSPSTEPPSAADLERLNSHDFHILIGLRPQDPDFTWPSTVPAHSLYHSINHAYSYVNWKYRIFDIATYVLLALQVLLAAIFIVLGSLTSLDSHVAIAVLGAISTVIGGVLALMKGQGLPNRLRMMRDNLRDVKFEAEEMYWDFQAGRRVCYGDVRKLRDNFVRVMDEARRNHPDTWNSDAIDIAQGIRARAGSRLVGPPAAGAQVPALPVVPEKVGVV
ncbi:hypothetical protein B0A48_15506 [Cryoendolithus antarcticus]|uniref:SMODS and SLOG-associating 2TM effector domain-containing protein n=1 Tax=Cryoendolithus antarcticus TaxID=1507870 RepID=A0A1V8SGY5_9PEZI|nr:hypothetical protein B0A48_15506 [Cryoendolithus antarcticus]